MKKVRLFVLTVAAVICLGVAQPAPAMNPPPMAVMSVAPAMAAAPMAVPAVMAPATEAPVAKLAAKKDSLGSVIGGVLLQILLAVLVIAVPIVLTPLVKWLLKKMKITDLQTQQTVDDIVDKAVVHGLNFANEHAHKLRDNPVKSAEKLNVAADKAIAYLKDSKIVDKGADYIKDLIEAKLGETRSEATPDADKPEVTSVEDKLDDK